MYGSVLIKIWTGVRIKMRRICNTGFKPFGTPWLGFWCRYNIDDFLSYTYVLRYLLKNRLFLLPNMYQLHMYVNSICSMWTFWEKNHFSTYLCMYIGRYLLTWKCSYLFWGGPGVFETQAINYLITATGQ